jgi:hypothetical protein
MTEPSQVSTLILPKRFESLQHAATERQADLTQIVRKVRSKPPDNVKRNAPTPNDDEQPRLKP